MRMHHQKLTMQIARLLRRSEGDKDGSTLVSDLLLMKRRDGDQHQHQHQQLEAAGLDDVRDDFGGVTLLQLAILADDLSLCKTLIEKGASVNQTNHHGHTPLHIALMVYGDSMASVVDLLLSKGADPSLRDKDKHSVLHWCAQTSRTQVFQTLHSALLLKATPKAPAASSSASAATTAATNAAINTTAPTTVVVLNSPDARGQTELHHAVLHQQVEMVECMIELGSNLLTNVDHYGRTALHLAAALGNKVSRDTRDERDERVCLIETIRSDESLMV